MKSYIKPRTDIICSSTTHMVAMTAPNGGGGGGGGDTRRREAEELEELEDFEQFIAESEDGSRPKNSLW